MSTVPLSSIGVNPGASFLLLDNFSYAPAASGGGCPSITLAPATLPNGTVGSSYNQTIAGSGGVGPYSFAVTSGALPAGVLLDPLGFGRLGGTPTRAGSFTFTIRATDTNGCFAEKTYTIVIVCPTITIAPPTLPAGTVAVAYSQPLTASGGSGSSVFTVSSGTLPAGLTLSSGGLLSGTPATAGSFTVTIQATDGNGCAGVITYTIVVAPPAGCPVITLAPPTLPAGTVAVAYSQQITASGGTAPYVFTVLSGTLPAGLTLSSGGLLSGTPTTAGSSTVTIRASDGSDTSGGCPGAITYTITITTAVPTLPQAFVLFLALGLAGVGYFRLRGRARAE